MADRVELPGGHWAVLRDPMDVTERERRPIRMSFAEQAKAIVGARKPAAPAAAGVTPQPDAAQASPLDGMDMTAALDASDAFEHQVITFLVTSWGGPRLDDREIVEDTLLDLPVPVYMALAEACAPLAEVLIPSPKATPSS